MNINKAKEEIQILLNEAQESNIYGGDESEDGCLSPGLVDWVDLKMQINIILDRIGDEGL